MDISESHIYHSYLYSSGQKSVYNTCCKSLEYKILPEIMEKINKLESYTVLPIQ